ncbi:MAG: FtsH protease activity modulator HflK [Candidatus Susulua stagnicola]|nr:FtsH protease activity modulator HflK [Candidatus Susulua stagnicola]
MDFQQKSPEEIIRSLKNKFNFNNSKKTTLPLIIGILVVISILKGAFYTIQPSEVGVILRFGKVVKTTSPGLHFKLPFGIEKAIPVPVEKVYTSEFGFRTRTSGVKSVYSQKSYDDESLMLTGDLNVLDLEWIVQFKIQDPFMALFNVRNVDKTIRDISESVLRRIVGNHAFNEVLTTKRIDINNQAQKEMQDILDSYEIGIQIVKLKLQDVNPPEQVKPAFNEVNQAKQEREKLKNQAWEVYNQKIPQAKGEALKRVKEAEGYALEKINIAQGDTKRFLLLYAEYAQAKEITLRRLYLEKMQDTLTHAGKKYILDPKEKGILPLLKLENEQ